jgi:transcription elongation factor Elf1
MAIDDLDTLEHKLGKRGFRRIDGHYYECTACHVHAVRKYATLGRTGGRDIALCEACGVSTSWRSVAGMEEREQDVGFDLRAFLG